MTSTLACVGLAVEGRDGLARLVAAVLPHTVRMGEVGGVEVLGWEDPSGSRLVLERIDGRVIDLLPSFAGDAGARLANVQPTNEDVAAAEVVDEAGSQVTALAMALEQRRMLPAAVPPVAGLASVVALGVDVSVHADADAFASSDASLLSDPGEGTEPPAHFVERGWPWPPRMATESFISYGVFGPPEQAQAYARINGIVLSARRRTVTMTGQDFVVARLRTTGFEADVCLAAEDHPDLPRPGQVIAGTAFLVVSLDLSPFLASASGRGLRPRASGTS